jgi:23S rRNA (adenine2030-N6)-methyltransferase
LWYPIKDRSEPDALARRLQRTGIPKLLRAEIDLASSSRSLERLQGSGLIIVNPPWTLEGELRTMLPALAQVLSGESRSATRIDWLADERN